MTNAQEAYRKALIRQVVSLIQSKLAKQCALQDIMVEKDRGLLAVHSLVQRPRYESSKRALFDSVWRDERVTFRPGAQVWNEMGFGLPLGLDLGVSVTTTPQPCPTLPSLLQGEGDWAAGWAQAPP